MIKLETCCITGHRPKSLPWGYNEKLKSCRNFKNKLYDIFYNVIDCGYKNFLTGMAEGFDMIATEILISLRKKFKHIKIIAILPCKNQELKWSKSQQKRYRKILKHCNNSIILSDNYTESCMNERNKFMVKHSSFVIACYNGKPSGTRNTIMLAKENYCKIEVINPLKFIF